MTTTGEQYDYSLLSRSGWIALLLLLSVMLIGPPLASRCAAGQEQPAALADMNTPGARP